MRAIIIAAVLLALSGCSTIEKYTGNRLVCTVARDRAFAVSLWGPVGISSEIDAPDAAVVCRP